MFRHYRTRPARRIAAAVFVSLLAAGLAGAQRSEPPPGLDAKALWLAEGDNLLKVATASAEIELEIPAGRARAVAVDPRRRHVWVHTRNELTAYDFTGEAVAGFALEREGSPRRGRPGFGLGFRLFPGLFGHGPGSDTELTIEPASGDVYLADGRTLRRFSRTGEQRLRVRLRHRIEAMALDPGREVLWLADNRGAVHAVDAEGNVIEPLSRSRRRHHHHPSVSALTYDSVADAFWLARRRSVVRVGPDGSRQVSAPVGHLQAVDADGAGGVWAIGRFRLVHITSEGRMDVETYPGLRARLLGTLDHLAADPSDGTVWVGNRLRAAHFAADGTLIDIQERNSDRGLPEFLREVVLFADVRAPELEFLSPDPDLWLADERPELRLRHSRDADLDTLAVTAADEDLAVDCRTLDPGEDDPRLLTEDSDCTPQRDLPEGEIALEATIDDFAGNTSEPAEHTVKIDTVAPDITIDTPDSGLITNEPDQTLSGGLSEPANLTVNGNSVNVDDSNRFSASITLKEGTNSLTFTAVDRAGNTTDKTITVTLDTVPPPQPDKAGIEVSLPEDGISTVTGGPGSVEPGTEVTVINTRTGETVTVKADEQGAFEVQIAGEHGDELRIAATDAAGNESPAADEAIGNRPPELEPVGAHTVHPGNRLTIQLTGRDPDGDRLRFAARTLPLPDNAELDARSGTLTFEPAAEQAGTTHTIELAAQDGEAVVTRTAEIEVLAIDQSAPTRLSGRLLDANAAANGKTVPVVGARVSIKGSDKVAVSDEQGRFALSGVPAGGQTIAIATDPAEPGPEGVSYARFVGGIELVDSAPNARSRPFYLPRINEATATKVDPDSTTEVVHEGFDIKLTIPPGSARNPDGSLFKGEVSIGVAPTDFLPVPLPEGVRPPIVVNINPAGLRFETPAEIEFPNVTNLPPGTKVSLMGPDQERQGLVPEGTGQVTADGERIKTIKPGLSQASWHVYSGDRALPKNLDVLDPPLDLDRTEQDECDVGSTVNSRTGCLTTGFQLPAYRSLDQSRRTRFVYRTGRAFPQPVIPTNVSGSFPGSLVGYEVALGGLQNISRKKISTKGDQFRLRIASPVDAKGVPTGTYPYSLQVFGRNQFWLECFPDGSAFCEARGGDFHSFDLVSVTTSGTVNIVNGRTSPVGTGWAISSLVKLHVNEQGDVLATRGDGSLVSYRLVEEGEYYEAPQGETSELVRTDSGGFERRFETGTVERFTASGLMIARVDRNGNRTSYEYDSQGRLTRITDPAGLETKLRYQGEHLSRVVDPAKRETELFHSPRGDLTKVVFPDGSTRKFSYDRNHLMVEETDRLGRTTERVFDDSGRFVKATHPDGSVWQSRSRQSKSLGDAISGGTLTEPVSGIASQDEADVTEVVNALGETREAELDESGRATVVRDPMGRTTRIDRARSGLPTKIDNPSGATTEFRISEDRIAEIGNDPFGKHVEFSFDRIESPATGAEVVVPVQIREKDGGDRGQDDGQTTLEYDENGNLTRVSTSEGRTREMSYGDNGLLSGMNFSFGAVAELEYTGRGNLRQRTIRAGGVERKTVFSHTKEGYLSSVVDPAGRRTELNYDEFGRVTRQVLPDGREIRLSYDAEGNLKSITPPGRPEHGFAHDAKDRRTAYDPPEVSGRAGATRFDYDGAGRLTDVERPGGETLELSYNPAGEVVEQRFPAGKRAMKYGPDTGLLLSIADPSGEDLAFEYDNGVLRQTTWDGPVSGEVRQSFDADGQVTKRAVNGKTAHRLFDDDGFLESVSADGLELDFSLSNKRPGPVAVDAARIETNWAYNGFGERIRRRTVLGRKGGPFSAVAEPAQVTDPQVQVTGNVNPESITAVRVDGKAMDLAPDGQVSGTVTLDSVGSHELEVVGETVNGNRVTDVIEVELVEGGTQRDFQDITLLPQVTSNGAVYWVGVAGGQPPFDEDEAALWRLPASGDQAVLVTGRVPESPTVAPDGTVYFAEGDALQVLTDDGGSRELAALPPGAGEIDFDFAAGPNGVVYMAMGSSVFRLNRAEGTLERVAGKGLGADLHLDRLEHGGDALVAASTDSGAFYDVNVTDGSITLRHQSGGFAAFAVGGSGRLCWLPGSTAPHVDNGGSDTSDNTVHCQVPGGAASDLGIQAPQDGGIALDASDRLYLTRGETRTDIVRLDGGTEVSLLSGASGTAQGTIEVSGDADVSLSGSKLTRDKLGRIVEETETVGGESHTFTYSYDAAGRLTEVTRDGSTRYSYSYDANSNRTRAETPQGTFTGTYDDQDRLISYGPFEYSYTPAGDLKSKTNTDTGATTTYDYDPLGNLRSVSLPDGREIDYIIDGRNRRVGKKVDGELVQGFLYQDRLNPVAELDGDNQVVARFIYGTKPNVPMAMVKIDPGTGDVTGTFRIVSDQIGSVRQVIDTETGEVVQRIDYSPFGQVLEDTNPGFQPFGFAGGLYDRDTGLVRFGARDYDPFTARWTRKDPILFAGGSTNLYGYVLNDPINLTDSNGQAICAGICTGALVAAGVGAVVGATSAGAGTLAAGGSLSQAGFSALAGGAVGAIPITGSSLLGSALVGGGKAAFTNFGGQFGAIALNECKGVSDFNTGSLVGATIGGSLTGPLSLAGNTVRSSAALGQATAFDVGATEVGTGIVAFGPQATASTIGGDLGN